MMMIGWQTLFLDENCKTEKFSIELIFIPSILDNITNRQVFRGDEQIFHIIHCENTFKDTVIDNGDHDEEINKEEHRDET